MRRVINLCILICVLLFSNMAVASDVLSVKITNSSTINVSLFNTRQGQKLFLKDYDGTILFDITLDASASYKKYFNLSLVKDGIYFVETETDYDVKVTPVIKNNKGIALINASVTTIFKPKTKLENGIVNLQFVNSKRSPITISIQDLDGVILHSEKMSGEEYIIKKAFNFSELPSGTYNLYVRLEDRVFTKEFSI